MPDMPDTVKYGTPINPKQRQLAPLALSALPMQVFHEVRVDGIIYGLAFRSFVGAQRCTRRLRSRRGEARRGGRRGGRSSVVVSLGLVDLMLLAVSPEVKFQIVPVCEGFVAVLALVRLARRMRTEIVALQVLESSRREGFLAHVALTLLLLLTRRFVHLRQPSHYFFSLVERLFVDDDAVVEPFGIVGGFCFRLLGARSFCSGGA